MPWFRPRDLLDQTFEVGIALKGLDGVLEVLGGFLLLVISPATIDRVVTSLTQRPAVRPSADLPTCSRFSATLPRPPVSLRGCNLLSNLSVLAANAASGGRRARRGRSPARPPGGGRPPPRALRTPARPAWDGRPADALRWSAPGLADHPHSVGQRPRHRQQVSVATAAREQHEVRGRHLGCTTLTRTTDASRLLRLATGAEPCDQEFPTGVSSPSHEVASRLAGALADESGRLSASSRYVLQATGTSGLTEEWR
jgi:hypothetical protein